MRTHVIARKTHKWLGLFIGLQVVVWSRVAMMQWWSAHLDALKLASA